MHIIWPMADAPPRFGPAQSPGFLLWHVNLRWQAFLAERLAPLGLTPAQLLVLGAVLWLERARGGQAPMQREISEQAGTDPMMTSQILRGLERRKLVVRRADPADKRALRIVATRAGQSTAGEAVAVALQANRDFFDAPLGDAAPLVEILRTLAKAAGAIPQALAATATDGPPAGFGPARRKRA